jgi:hydroxyacylglutathione hydrolase
VVYRELGQFNPGACVLSAEVHVERFESALWQTASLLLVADGEAVVVDPCISSEEVAVIAARAQALDAPVSHILTTHADWDHLCGIAAFPDAVAAMGERSAEAVASGAPAAVIAQRAVEYDVTVAGPPRVDRALAAGAAHRIGPFVVETVALPGHTADGTAYRVRALDMLAVGDHLSAVEFPFVSSTADYRMTLAGLIDLLRHDPPAQVVPGHGPALTAAEALAIAEADLGYLRALRDAVAGALAANADRGRARVAGLAVEPPRTAPGDLAGMRAANVEAQLDELVPQ